jgi:HPt (histidine-containing phosphotransfer) domain-containing protein
MPHASAPATGLEVIDTLVQFAGASVAGEMISLFLRLTPERVQVARDALARGDRNELRAVSHLMKSGAAQLGVFGLQQACLSLEHEAREGDASKLPELVGAVEREAARASEQLTGVQHSLSRM